jgi:pre-rRNA-processing protein TSR4
LETLLAEWISMVYLGFAEPLGAAVSGEDEPLDESLLQKRETPSWWASQAQEMAERQARGGLDGKIGGKPVFLAKIGPPEAPICAECSEPMVFLLQCFAPLGNRSDEAGGGEKAAKFGPISRNERRIVCVFACRDPECHFREGTSGPFAVLRCCAPGIEGGDSGRGDDSGHFAPFAPNQCAFCGCRASKVCGSCKKVRYCSVSHQRLHWRYGHKGACSSVVVSAKNGEDSSLAETELFHVDSVPAARMADTGLFWESELVSEPEENTPEAGTGTEEGVSPGSNNGVESGSSGSSALITVGDSAAPAAVDGSDISAGSDLTREDWEEVERETKEMDSVMIKFQDRIRDNPDQVFRYYDRIADGDESDAEREESDNALWVMKDHRPGGKDVPDCERCGSRRVLEFQIMPQLLAELRVTRLEGSSIDWGVLSIYTCARSCAPPGEADPYAKEVLWKQSHAT